MAKKPKVVPRTPEQIREDSIAEQMKNFVPYPPAHRIHKVGAKVKYGGHHNAEVIGVFDNGRVIEVRTWGEYQRYHNLVYEERTQILNWLDVVPLVEQTELQSLKQNQDIRLDYSNMTIDSMLHCFYGAGIDMNPDYQRDYVWSEEDQVKLIDSIFNNRSIGTYILVNLGYSGKYTYEVLDGKQRIKALCDFYEDRFKYKGKFFSELKYEDQYYFGDRLFPRAEIRESRDQEVPKEKKIKIFLHVNTCGRIMDEEHLNKIRKMLKED